jgi:hypothetical protein
MHKLKCKLLAIEANTEEIKPVECVGWVFRNDKGVYTHLTLLEDIIKAHSYFGAKPQLLYLISPETLVPAYDWCSVYNSKTNEIEEHYSSTPKQVDLVIASNDTKLKLPNISDDVKKHFVKNKGSFEAFEVQINYSINP